MPGSRASVFGEMEDFLAALSADGVTEMLPTGRGQFQARLTQVGLERLRLAAVEEAQSRIAFITVPAGMVLVSFPVNGGPSPIWGGVEIRAGEMITLGPGQRVHARTVGPCRWHIVQVPERQLAEYGRALSGARFIVRPAARWPTAALRAQASAPLPPSRHPDGGGPGQRAHRPSGSARARAAIAARADRVSVGRGRGGDGGRTPPPRPSCPVRGICSPSNRSVRSPASARRSAYRRERCASAAKSIWGRVRAAIADSAQRIAVRIFRPRLALITAPLRTGR
jgi:hypothetical protein